MEILESKILQLRLDAVNSQPSGQWSINFKSFQRLLFPLLRYHIFQSPHVVKPVSQLDYEDSDVL